MDDALTSRIAAGYRLLERIDSEYADARKESAVWAARGLSLIQSWRSGVDAWTQDTLPVLRDAGERGRFEHPPISPTAVEGNVEWNAVRKVLRARLEILDALRQRPISTTTVTVSGVGNVVAIASEVRNRLQIVNESNPELARQLAALVTAIQQTRELNESQRQEALELTRTVTEEVARPVLSRSRIQTTSSALGSLLSRAAELAAIWEAIRPLLEPYLR